VQAKARAKNTFANLIFFLVISESLRVYV